MPFEGETKKYPVDYETERQKEQEHREKRNNEKVIVSIALGCLGAFFREDKQESWTEAFKEKARGAFQNISEYEKIFEDEEYRDACRVFENKIDLATDEERRKNIIKEYNEYKRIKERMIKRSQEDEKIEARKEQTFKKFGETFWK